MHICHSLASSFIAPNHNSPICKLRFNSWLARTNSKEHTHFVVLSSRTRFLLFSFAYHFPTPISHIQERSLLIYNHLGCSCAISINLTILLFHHQTSC